MKNWTNYFLSGLFLLASFVSFSQNNDVEMADTFRQEGKIYVVVTVALTLLIGIFILLFRLDKKVKNLEKEVGINS